MKYKKKGLFISFEGAECSGKSTQIIKLKNFFIKNKIPHKITREPGGTKINEILRKIILEKKYRISTTEEILLLMSARSNHINSVIKPSIDKGKVVISDRFADSTFVYQGYVNKFGLKNAISLHKKILKNYLPVKTFLFMLDAKEIIKRIKKRKYYNKYDKIDINFHKKVIQGYRKLSRNNNRFIIIDAEKRIGDIQKQIQSSILKYLNK